MRTTVLKPIAIMSIALLGAGWLHAQPVSAAATPGWISLFDGRSLTGWKASEQPGSFKVVDGQIACDGPRSHLFYTGAVGGADLKNFELKADVLTKTGANSGIYFHTAFQENGFPNQGFEVQVHNARTGSGDYRENKLTGSLYGIRNQYKATVKDNEWFNVHVIVRGKHVQIRVNDVLLVDYVEPETPVRLPQHEGRVLAHGTFALQCHDPGSKAFFKNIQVKPLPDNLDERVEYPQVDAAYRQILGLQMDNFPVVNYHVHLKGGLTLAEALQTSRQTGINYGIAVNCGLGFSVTNDAGIAAYLDSMKGQPVFVGMQAEGREWVNLFSKDAIAKFDYVFTDSMTFTDRNGKRMRLWIKDEVQVGDKQVFMDTLVERILGIMDHEPIDIYVNPTFLPDVIAKEYDALWTPERMRKVVEATARNHVAMEINARYRLPSPAFIKLAKQAGVKFTMGTNNGDRLVGDLDYCLQMVRECSLTWQDMFVPKPDGQKPVQVRR